jgi:hemerythrin
MLKNAEGFASNTAPFAFLERWLEAHLTNDDKKFADFLAERAPPVAAVTA